MTIRGQRFRVGNPDHPFHQVYLRGGHEAVYIAMGLINPKRRAEEIRQAALAMYNSCREGYVYLITNDAWRGWVKCGMAVDADDRCASLNTGSPYRDYKIAHRIFCEDRFEKEREAQALLREAAIIKHGEWFYCDVGEAIELLESIR